MDITLEIAVEYDTDEMDDARGVLSLELSGALEIGGAAEVNLLVPAGMKEGGCLSVSLADLVKAVRALEIVAAP